MTTDYVRLTLNPRLRYRLGEVREKLKMGRCHPVIICCTIAGVAGCHQINRYDRAATGGFAKITFQVSGMMKTKSGATWMGWPDAVTASLEGINGTKQIDWDYARDLVTISYDSQAAAPNAYAAAIAKLGYEAKSPPPVLLKRARPQQLKQLPIPPDAPRFFVDAIQRAQRARRPIVIDFWAEWCVACLRLKRETLENTEVATALRSVELIYVDLDEYPSLGDAYGVAAIPDLILADESARIVDRLQSFEGPEEFVDRLKRVFGSQRNNDASNK